MLSENGDGVLNDWNCGAFVHARERCRSVSNPLSCTSMRCSRDTEQYTYHYVSIDVLHFGGQIQSYVHDPESCFWTLLSCAHRLFALTGDVAAAEAKFSELFPDPSVHHSEWIAMVAYKFEWLIASDSVIQFECAPLNWLVEKLRTMWGEWYRDRFKLEECPEAWPFEGDEKVQYSIDFCQEALAMEGWPDADARHVDWELQVDVPGTPAIESVVGDISWLDHREDGKLTYYEVKPRYDEHAPQDDYVPSFFLARHLKRLALKDATHSEEKPVDLPASDSRQAEQPAATKTSVEAQPQTSFVFGHGTSRRPMKGLPHRRINKATSGRAI